MIGTMVSSIRHDVCECNCMDMRIVIIIFSVFNSIKYLVTRRPRGILNGSFTKLRDCPQKRHMSSKFVSSLCNAWRQARIQYNYIVLLYEYDVSERHSSVNGAAAFLASTLLLKLPLQFSVLGKKVGNSNYHVYLLPFQNFWASYCAKNSVIEVQVTIGIVNELCQSALELLTRDVSSCDELNVTSLEAIAKARCALTKIAEFMYMSVVSDDERCSNQKTRAVLNPLFNHVQALCASVRSSSPTIFLLKQLVKRYGVNSIATVSQKEELSWIVPAEFRQIGVRDFQQSFSILLCNEILEMQNQFKSGKWNLFILRLSTKMCSLSVCWPLIG